MASFNCSSESFHPLNPPVSSSFTRADDDDDKPYPSSLFSGGAPQTIGSGLPDFKSAPSPPLPISPSSFFSISEYLDSPLLLSSSHILVSPTTGASPVQAFGWANNYPDFSFRPHPTSPSPSAMQESCSLGELQELQAGISPEIVTNSTQNNKNFSFRSGAGDCPKPIQSYRVNSNVVDGYNWRKYGQKQVKKSENPRSYYKCTHPGCLTKKIVETSLDGQTTEIIYKGNHNHPKPEFIGRSSSAPSSGCGVVASNASHFFNPCCNIKTHDQSSAAQGFSRMESVATSENSSVSYDYGDVDHKNGNQEKSISGTDEIDEEEPDNKRWKREAGDEGISSGGSRGGKEARVVVQTMSDIDVLPDGYKWRKYGQKVVKGNPNPRSYYKCTERGCGVRKHVERAAHDARAVMTTYEGRHNHCVPTPVKPYKP